MSVLYKLEYTFPLLLCILNVEWILGSPWAYFFMNLTPLVSINHMLTFSKGSAVHNYDVPTASVGQADFKFLYSYFYISSL
jgi:hypothetical protein